MYSAKEGFATDWQFAHLSTFARGKAGLVFTEATAVEPRGRITPVCLGIWSDEQAEAIRPTVRFIEEMGCVPGMQIAHAGRKGSAEPPFQGGTPLAADHPDAWQTVAPSADPVGEGWPVPHALDTGEIAEIVADFATAARRAADIGFKVLEVHGAHGYLIQSFLSPLGNKRNDAYGGDIQGRMRFALEVAEAVREAWPCDLPLFYRISAVDTPNEGWSLDDSVILSRELAARGVDVVDCSAGGIRGAPAFRVNDSGKPMAAGSERPPGFQVPYADRVRNDAEVMTMAVGVITEPDQAEEILQEGRADLVALGREIMYNPFWPLHAAHYLGADPECGMWPDQYRWAVQRRADIAAQNARASVRSGE
jgi:2,4-dienoyl-CoA reductase-like NADH-dependent reductase (Old Yellow Enzyme family)